MSRKKKKMKPLQFTKILMTGITSMLVFVTLTGIYISYKNGFNLNSIMDSWTELFKVVFAVYGTKAFLETKEKEKVSLQREIIDKNIANREGEDNR